MDWITESNRRENLARSGCLIILGIMGIIMLILYNKCDSSRRDFEGTYYRFHTETQTIDKNEYIIFGRENFKWYENGKVIEDFKYEYSLGKSVQVVERNLLSPKTFVFSISDDKSTVTIEGKEFRKQEQ